MTRWLETDSNTNIDISAATVVGSYTADADRLVVPQLLIDQAAGNGDYVYYAALQVNGGGSWYVIGPKTTHAAASGETAIGAQGGAVAMRSGDVLRVYVDGLAGDTSTPDVVVRFFEYQPVREALATELGRVDAAVSSRLAAASYSAPPSASDNATAAAYAVWNENIADHLGPTSTGGHLDLASRAGPVGDMIESVGYNRFKITALENMPAAVGLATANLDAQLGALALEATAQAILAVTAQNGAGSVAWTYTLTSDVDATPIPQARVEVWNATNDVLITQAYTDNNGQALFYLDPGTYSLRRSKAGWSFALDTETVEEPAP